MGLWFATAVALLAAGLVLTESPHSINKRQTQYPQRGRPPQRFRTGFQAAPVPDEVVTEYVEQPYFQQQQPPRYARVSSSIRGSQQPSFTITDEVDHQPPEYDQEVPAPRYTVTAEGPPTPYGPQRRRPQYPITPPTPQQIPQGRTLTFKQEDLIPINYANPRRPSPPAPPRPTLPEPSLEPPRAPPPVFNYDDLEDGLEDPSQPVPPPPPSATAPPPPPPPLPSAPVAPARTVLLSQGPLQNRPPLDFAGAVLVTEDKPEPPPTTRPQRGRGTLRRTSAPRRPATPAEIVVTTTEPPPLQTVPARRAGARRPAPRFQTTQSIPPPTPPPVQTTRAAPVPTTAKRPAIYNQDSNLAPPPDEEEFNLAATEAAPPRKFTRKPTEAAPEEPPSTAAPPKPNVPRRPGGKRLKIGTLPPRPTTTTTTTEAPADDEEDYDDPPPPPPPPTPKRKNTRTRGNGPRPGVVFEEPSESQAEADKRPPRPRVSGRPTNKAFRPRPVEDYEDQSEDTKPKPSIRSESSRPASGRVQSGGQDDYEEDYEEYAERPATRSRGSSNNEGKYRGRFRSREDREREEQDSTRGSRGRGRPGPPPSPKPTRRTPPKDLPKRKDGRVVDYLGDPNFPRELSGYDLTDYPFYVSLPDDVSNFDCEERANGFYASVPHQCQVFHYCFVGNRYSFLCANYTLYDQTTFTCQFANKVNCEKSERYYNRNDDLYKEDDDKKKKDSGSSDSGNSKEVKAPGRGGSRTSSSSSQAKKKSKS